MDLRRAWGLDAGRFGTPTTASTLAVSMRHGMLSAFSFPEDVTVCSSFCDEEPNDVRNEGVGMLGMKPAGMEMDGKAFDSLFSAFSLTEDDR